MSDQPSADELCRRMSDVRGQLGDGVAEIIDSARQLVNWRQYVQMFPWASLALVATLGYLAVPRRLVIVSPDAEALEKLARKNRLVVEHRPRSAEKRTAVASLADLTGNMLLRAVLGYAGRQMGRLFSELNSENATGGREVEPS